jgi:hypothetical protein
MYLPLDIIHHIIDALTVPSIDSNEPGSNRTSTLCAASWISKDFASITRRHLFQDVIVRSETRCRSLLTLLKKNPTLQTIITHLVLAPSTYQERPLPNRHPGDSWIVSPMASSLIKRLHRLSGMTFLKIVLDVGLADCIITHTLRSRQHDITRLNITSYASMSLHDLDRFIMSLSSLETISMDANSISWVFPSREEDRDLTGIHEPRKHPLRRMKLQLRGDQTRTKLPTWFTSRTYLSSIKELDLACYTSPLSESAWDMIIAASSSLTHLTLHTPPVHDIFDPSIRLKTLFAPALTSLRLFTVYGNQLTMEWMIAVLSSIAPCTTMRKLEMDNVKHRLSNRYDPTIALWGRIDDILTRTFPHLQRAHIEIEWEIYHSDRVPEEEAIRLAMPGLDKMGILELAFSVKINDKDRDSPYDFSLSLFD